MSEKFAGVDEYIDSFPADVQKILHAVRQAIHAGMPATEEKIRYGMPAVMLAGRYGLHFAGWKRHIGLYPVPRFDGDLEAAIAPYRDKKDTVSFKYAEPIPFELITRVAAEIARRGPGL